MLPLLNLLAAHAIRFRLTWSRAGIIMIHAGIIIMMLGEVITGVYAVEGQMIIRVGEGDLTHSESTNGGQPFAGLPTPVSM